MQPIHVQTDDLRDFSRKMMHAVNLLLEEEFKLRKALTCLEMDWVGGSSEDFFASAKSLQENLHARIDDYYELARKVLHESDRWEECDHSWVQEYRKNLVK